MFGRSGTGGSAGWGIVGKRLPGPSFTQHNLSPETIYRLYKNIILPTVYSFLFI